MNYYESIIDQRIIGPAETEKKILLEDCEKITNYLKAGNKIDVYKSIKYFGIFNLEDVVAEILEITPLDIRRQRNENKVVEYWLNDSMKYSNDQLLEFLCSIYGVKPEQIKSKSRRGQIVHVRHLFCFLGYFYKIENSTSLIGEFVGRDHSTVIHSIGVVRDMSSTDEDYKEDVQDLMKLLKIDFKFLNYGQKKKIEIINYL